MLDIKIGSVLLGYSLQEQTQILDCVYGGEDPKTKRIEDAGRAIVDIIMQHEEIVEGYAGFPVEKKLIDSDWALNNGNWEISWQDYKGFPCSVLTDQHGNWKKSWDSAFDISSY